MIYFVVTRPHAYTIRQFLETWGRDLRAIIQPLSYDEIAGARSLNAGAYVFSDLERLTQTQSALASTIAAQLAAHPDAFTILNRPDRALCRYDLLRALHAAEINRFNVHRLDDLGEARFPLFLRRASEHDGAASPLLESSDDLAGAINNLKKQNAPLDDFIAVEFLDTADATGFYRKYSAFRVGDRVIARHLFHGKNWVLKMADEVIEPWMVEEELVYLRGHPHEAQLRRVFEIANIDYGRIDYSVIDGCIQVWEINTNPMIAIAPARIDPKRLLGQGIFVRQFVEAMRGADRASNAPPLSIRLTRSMRAQSEPRCWKKSIACFARRIANRLDSGG